ncbi:MAG: CheR family methyltransferase [Vulcanimicrobiaceae bacterium]
MIAPLPSSVSVADIELQLLLEAVNRFAGYDFRDYAPAFVKRRVAERMRAEGLRTISALQERVLHDGEALDRFVFGLSSRSSELFDEPSLFAEMRNTVMPMLRTFPLIRAWVVGCGRGEEAYSLAILLREEGLGRRARIYATDVSGTAIGAAKDGKIHAETLDGAFRRYREAGGKSTLEDYISFNGDTPSMNPALRENIVFSTHSLVSDGSFNEFHLVLCRELLPQFNKALSYRAHQVIFDSLGRGGYLVLGPSESIRLAPHQRCFERVSQIEQIHRRTR